MPALVRVAVEDNDRASPVRSELDSVNVAVVVAILSRCVCSANIARIICVGERSVVASRNPGVVVSLVYS